MPRERGRTRNVWIGAAGLLFVGVLVVYIFVNSFLHAGDVVPLAGFTWGPVAALLAAGLVAWVLRTRRTRRILGGVAAFLVTLPLFAVGIPVLAYDMASGENGTRFVPLAVWAERVYLKLVPEEDFLRDEHRYDHVFYAELAAALHACDERGIVRLVDEAGSRAASGHSDVFVFNVLRRFLVEKWCPADLTDRIRDRMNQAFR